MNRNNFILLFLLISIVLLLVIPVRAVENSKTSIHGAAQIALPNPLVRIGVKNNESPYRLSGAIQRLEEGTFCLSAQPPWRWITVGKDAQPLSELEGLQSFTICGWVGPSTLLAGAGGNRIAFNLN